VTLASRKRMGALALAATFVVAACGGPAATTAPTGAPASQPAGSPAAGGATGSVNVSGSSTVEPISTGVAEAFAAANPGFAYTIEGPGTGDGFKKFCAGETDRSRTKRPRPVPTPASSTSSSRSPSTACPF
jgi:phosphate transport system substrate-binding protein